MLIGRTNATPADFEATLDRVGAQLDVKKAEVERKIGEAWDLMAQAPASPAKQVWLDAIAKKAGVDKAFYSLLEQVEPVKAYELRIAGEEQKRLGAVVTSFTSLCRNLRALNEGPAEEAINPVLAKDQYELRSSLLADVDAIRKALRAAGDKVKEVGVFPIRQLGLIEAKAEVDAQGILEARDRRLAALPNGAVVLPAQVATVDDAARALGKTLGDADLTAQLVKAAEKVPAAERAAFTRNLGALAMMADVATTALDYSSIGYGWGKPDSRLAYRSRQYDEWLLYASESRLDATHSRMLDLARDVARAAEPEKVLDRGLVSAFLTEIGVPAGVAQGWKVTSGGVAQALAHEALLPLRALNETIDDVALERKDAKPYAKELRRVVTDVTRHILEGDYREWRYTSPQSTKQLAPLTDAQRAGWRSNLSLEGEGVGGVKLKTREEDGPELLWVTKIGGPSHGFDYGPHCLLPLLANGRTKAILVEDPRWPHNAAARCYLRVLQGDDGKAMLYLEPMQRDFPHRARFDKPGVERKESAAVRFLQVQHALAKAAELGLPLSVSASDDAILDALGVAHQRDKRKLVIEGSAGVFEASDTMFRGHDFPQTQRLVTEPQDLRVLVQPPQAKE